MIAAWKFRRELQRLRQQISALHEAVWEPWVQRRHDQAFERGFPAFDGAGSLNPKIALFLIYQKGALPQSIIETCEHIARHGYSVFIVANGGLPAESRAQLLPYVWKILERPNVGYDFGGYRDGILQLEAWGIAPDKLLILNDSIWFPIFENDTLLDRMEASGADVAGTVLRQKDKVRFLESYLYLIDGRVLKNADVQRFWRKFKLTANKYKVIRRGERGHSLALQAAGFHLQAMFSKEEFLSLLAKQDDDFLEKTLRYGVAETAGLSQQHAALLARQKATGWRAEVDSHIEQVLQSAQFYSAFPFAAVRLMQYPILKRSSDMVSALWRKAYFTATRAETILMPLEPILNEFFAQVEKDKNK